MTNVNAIFFLVGALAGSIILYCIMQGVIKYLRKVNAQLMNESDFYFFKLNIAMRKMSPVDQAVVLKSPEMEILEGKYKTNCESIERTGRY